ncbi:hypothetical protein NPIL_389761 [Nephila pilipes]|uniref:Uncharacterized protein n=1 Tax=Nephila pilipes TaxID=299642 RepID=A0A8X6TA43_NEPPI|nr:hypothetical protein NPIL_389761 [Nephila pilipes]
MPLKCTEYYFGDLYFCLKKEQSSKLEYSVIVVENDITIVTRSAVCIYLSQLICMMQEARKEKLFERKNQNQQLQESGMVNESATPGETHID